MKQRITSILLAVAALFSVMGGRAYAASQNLGEIRAGVEKQYSVKIEFAENESTETDADKINYILEVGNHLSKIPPELHEPLVAHLKASGKTMRVRINPQMVVLDGHTALGTYDHSNARITLIATDEYVFFHEYGHMLHAVLNEKYGATKLTNEWTALNGGKKYGAGESNYDKTVYDSVFITGRSTVNMGEDVAETFACFTSQTGVRKNYETINDTNIWKKAMLLEQAGKTALKTGRVFFPTYIPQTPSPWAADAVGRGFGDNFDRSVLGSKERDILLYQEAISRGEYCEFLVSMINAVSINRHGKGLYDIYYKWSREERTWVPCGTINDPKTGNAMLDDELLPEPYTDGVSTEVLIASYLGVVAGVGDSFFDYYGKITREQAAVMLARACEVLGYVNNSISAPPTDFDSVSPWAKSGVDYVMRTGIMVGSDGAFSPRETYTYEQSYVTLVRIYDCLAL